MVLGTMNKDDKTYTPPNHRGFYVIFSIGMLPIHRTENNYVHTLEIGENKRKNTSTFKKHI